MNEHAKKIYQAALDGKTVQRRREFWVDDWEDKDPFEAMEGLWPWRIKPRIETRYYRVYLLKDTKEIGVIEVLNKDEKANAEVHYRSELKPFEWISQWVPYEVEVEEC